jgi:hypothetical protein
MSDTLGTIRTKDLPDTGSISGADVVLVDNDDGTRGKTITELAAALAGGVADVVKTFVRLASVANVADLTTLITGATLDGKTLALADRIFLPYQTTAGERGIYVVANSGAPARATDFDATGDVARGAVVFVTTGDVNAGTAFVLTTGPAAGITATTWSHIRAHSAGSGVTMTPAGVIAADISGSTPQPVGTAAAGASGKVSDAAHVHAITAATIIAAMATAAASLAMNAQKITGVANPTAAQDAATKAYTDQPGTRSSSSTTPPAISASDIGGSIKLTNAGAITLPTADLSGSLRSSGSIYVNVFVTGGGTVSISDGSGCTHSGTPGALSFVLWTDDGVTWLVR